MRYLKSLGFVFLIASTRLFAQQIVLLSPKIIELGDIEEGRIVKSSIRFINKASENLTIKKVVPGCGCTVAAIDKYEYAPDDTVVIPFYLKTKGYQGFVRKPITIEYEQKRTRELEILVQARIHSDFEISPNYLTFPKMKQNPEKTYTQYITIRNTSKNPVKLWDISASNDLIELDTSSETIPPGREKVVEVTFCPRRPGRESILISMRTDYQGKPKITIPIYVYIEE